MLYLFFLIKSMLSKLISSVQLNMNLEQASPIKISTPLSFMQTELHGETMQMQSWAWQSERIAFARLTHLHSPQRVQLFNFTIYPHTTYLGAMFASDWVVLNGKLRIGVMDAMPFFDTPAYATHWIQPFEPLHQTSLAIAPVYVRTDDWSYQYLSPNACMASQITDLTPLMLLWEQYLQQYLACLHTAPKATVGEQERQQMWQAHYNQTHVEVELKRNPLLHYFGRELGEAYLKEFLFSNSF